MLRVGAAPDVDLAVVVHGIEAALVLAALEEGVEGAPVDGIVGLLRADDDERVDGRVGGCEVRQLARMGPAAVTAGRVLTALEESNDAAGAHTGEWADT